MNKNTRIDGKKLKKFCENFKIFLIELDISDGLEKRTTNLLLHASFKLTTTSFHPIIGG